MKKEELKSFRYWEILMLVLSIYVVIQLSVEVILPFSEHNKQRFEQIDLVICFIFLFDFFFFLYHAESKRDYWKKRWVDFVASIPFMSMFRIFRLFRIVRVLRVFRFFKLMRGIRGVKGLADFLNENRLRGILVLYVFCLFLALFYCALAFYSFEKIPNENVDGFDDALWWAFITITSVGYGDIYPVTNSGRIVAVVMTLGGMGLYSLVTAELAAVFLNYLKQDYQIRE